MNFLENFNWLSLCSCYCFLLLIAIIIKPFKIFIKIYTVIKFLSKIPGSRLMHVPSTYGSGTGGKVMYGLKNVRTFYGRVMRCMRILAVPRPSLLRIFCGYFPYGRYVSSVNPLCTQNAIEHSIVAESSKKQTAHILWRYEYEPSHMPWYSGRVK